MNGGERPSELQGEPHKVSRLSGRRADHGIAGTMATARPTTTATVPVRYKQNPPRTASGRGVREDGSGRPKGAGQAGGKRHRLFTHFSAHAQLIATRLSGSAWLFSLGRWHVCGEATPRWRYLLFGTTEDHPDFTLAAGTCLVCKAERYLLDLP